MSKQREREIDIPVKLPSTMPEGECLDMLRTVVGGQAGVREVGVDEPSSNMRIRFDPKNTSLNEVQRVAGNLGIEMAHQFEHCGLRLRGVKCTDCLDGLERRLAAVPGAGRVLISPAAASITVEYAGGPEVPELLTDVAQAAGYAVTPAPHSAKDAKADREEEAAERFRMALCTSGCLTALILAWVGEQFALLPGSAVAACYILSYLSGGYYSTLGALRDLREGSVNVDLLMIAAAMGAAFVGAWAEGAVLLFLFSLSGTLEGYVLGRTRRAIQALMDLAPEEAVVRRDEEERTVPVGALRIGDIVIVRPGERIPADGTLTAGRTSVDQSAMTGESIPVEKTIGDGVFAATLNQEGAIELEVTHLAGESTLARIVQLVEEAQSEKAESQRFTDWFGQYYTIGVLGLSAATALVPILFLGEAFATAFYRAMTVLVVASPCAVVISIPAAILSGITSAARGGVLFKGGAHLEQLGGLNAIAFDKTGTLTLGRPQVTEVYPAPGTSEEELLRLAASAESLSEHPLAKAILLAARERGIQSLPSANMEARIGQGIRAEVEGRHVWVGQRSMFDPEAWEMDPQLEQEVPQVAAKGNTIVYLGVDGRILGLLAIADSLRPDTEEALKQLRGLGIKHLVMLTGDHWRVAEAIAEPLGLEFEAELMPEDKLRVVERLRQDYGSVGMIGDGINDAPALATASIGMSLGSAGTDVALETADVVLMADDLSHLPYAVALSRQANRIIRQNLVFALGVMLVLLGVTYFGSLRLPFAVVGHEGSTVLVILNGLRLLWFPKPGE